MEPEWGEELGDLLTELKGSHMLWESGEYMLWELGGSVQWAPSQPCAIDYHYLEIHQTDPVQLPQ